MATVANRAVGSVLALGLVAVALWGVQVTRADSTRMPSTDDVSAANIIVAEMMTLGDAVRPVPFWFADARLGFSEWPILAGNEPDEWEVHRFERVFIVYPTTHEPAAREEADRLGLVDIAVAHETATYAALVGHLPETSTVLWDAAEQVRDARARQVGDSEVLCDSWIHDAWHCGRFNAYIFAGARVREMGDQEPRRCIAMNAPEPPASWRLAWDEVPAAGHTLRIRAGNTYEAVRAERGAPVALRVRVDGDVVHEAVFGIHDPSHESVEIVMPQQPVSELQFEVGSTDHFDRFFCVQAQIVE